MFKSFSKRVHGDKICRIKIVETTREYLLLSFRPVDPDPHLTKGLRSKRLDFAFYIGSTPTFLYFDLYLNNAYATHYVYFTIVKISDQ